MRVSAYVSRQHVEVAVRQLQQERVWNSFGHIEGPARVIQFAKINVRHVICTAKFYDARSGTVDDVSIHEVGGDYWILLGEVRAYDIAAGAVEKIEVENVKIVRID